MGKSRDICGELKSTNLKLRTIFKGFSGVWAKIMIE